MTSSVPLGRRLLEQGHITQDQLQIAIQEQGKHHQLLGKLLVQLGFVAEATLRDVLAAEQGQESITLGNLTIAPATLRLVPRELALRHQVLPLAVNLDLKQLTLAISDPGNVVALDQLRAHLRNEFDLTLRIASPSDLQHCISKHYDTPHGINALIREIEPDSATIPDENVRNRESSPLVRLVDALLNEAIQQSASDIHFEPESHFLRIRYRVDGLLQQMHSLHLSFWPGMLVRLKVMSGMNIAETRSPQDGHFSLNPHGRIIDFRAATHPTIHGENLVLRILDRQKSIVQLEHLGLDETTLALLKAIIGQPEGIVLVTGPTGSGKTTTLYSILAHINHESLNIMTLEDPVEYTIPLIRQSSLNETARLDFVNGIRSIMRQDPDVILIGEIRDQATAEMAFRAALTGHQVYATLHANSAIGAIPRLLDLGIQPDILTGNLSGILAQRLVRTLCPHCKQPSIPDADERALLGLPPGTDATLYRPVGCAHCRQQGYAGRRALIELLRLDGTLDELIAHRTSPRAIKRVALERGLRSLAQDARQQILAGITSLNEAMRVVDLTERLA